MVAQVVSLDNHDKPIIRRKALSAHNSAGMTTRVNCGEFGMLTFDEPVAHGGAGEGPSPLQGVLACLCSCEAVTFNRTAAEFDFGYSAIDFDAAYTIDIRGRQGVRTVVPHFQTVRVEATVTTDEPEDRLRAVVEETEARCPVYNLIRDANVKIEILWIRKLSIAQS